MMKLSWNDFKANAPFESDQWASSDRGWIYWDNHPDWESETGYFQSTCVGNYLAYDRAQGQCGERIHACAYVFYQDEVTGMIHHTTTQSQWFHTVAEARTWIEAASARIAERMNLTEGIEYQPALPMT